MGFVFGKWQLARLLIMRSARLADASRNGATQRQDRIIECKLIPPTF
jgi:hypothetical protein